MSPRNLEEVNKLKSVLGKKVMGKVAIAAFMTKLRIEAEEIAGDPGLEA